MRDINKIIQDLYGAYVKKDLVLMKSLLEEGKTIDENNSYLKKYESLYDTLNSGGENNSKEEKIVQFGGKTIKCPHCGSNLSLSENNKKVIEDFKAGNSKELNFKCKYCNTEFKWSETGMKPLYLNISVGNEIILDNKKYRVSGGARYIGNWQTKNSGKLEYIERILIDDKGDTYYLSESKALWNEDGESGIEYQTEISRKIIPDFNLGELSENNIVINGSNYNITEICNVKVSEVYGENSKSFTIGEEIITYQLNYGGKDYVFEKEKTKSQVEVGVYHTWEIDDKDLKKGSVGINSNKEQLGNWIMFFGAIVGTITSIITGINLIISVMICIILSFILSGFTGDKINKNIIISDFIGSISFFVSFNFIGLLLFFFSSSILGSEITIKELSINELIAKNLNEARGLYKVNFSDTYKKDVGETTNRYDYGGIMHNISYLDGLKFKVESQKDLDTLKSLLDGNLKFTNQYKTFSADENISNYFKDNMIVNFK